MRFHFICNWSEWSEMFTTISGKATQYRVCKYCKKMQIRDCFVKE